MKSYKNFILQSHMEICYMQNNILYETYDCVLQYVQFSAYSHNFQINNIFSLSSNNGIYYIYTICLLNYNIYISYIFTNISSSILFF